MFLNSYILPEIQVMSWIVLHFTHLQAIKYRYLVSHYILCFLKIRQGQLYIFKIIIKSGITRKLLQFSRLKERQPSPWGKRDG